MKPITITLNEIKKHRPCKDSWAKALEYFGEDFDRDKPIPVSAFLDSNGLDDTLRMLDYLPEHNNLWRLFAVWCASQVKHLMDDERCLRALDVAEQYALGRATDEDLAAARAAARSAYLDAYDAGATYTAARAAVYAAADDIADAAQAAAADAQAAAAYDADAAWAAAYAATYAARSAQADALRRLLDTGEINIKERR